MSAGAQERWQTAAGLDGRPYAAQATERRRYLSPTRQSWAGARPYVLADDVDPQAALGPVERAQLRRDAWTRPHRARAMQADALISATVVALCTASLQVGWTTTALAGLAGGAIWIGAVAAARGYEGSRMGEGAEEFEAILRAALGIMLALGVTAYSVQYLLPRREVLLAVPLVAACSAVVRHGLRKRLHRRRQEGAAMLRTLVIGEPVAVQRLTDGLCGRPSHGFDVVGACVPAPGPEIQDNLVMPVLGGTSDIPQVVVDHDIDAVIVVGSQLSGPALRRLSWALERTGAQLLVEPGLVEVAGPNVSLRPAAGLSLLHLEKPSARAGRLLGKLVLDRVLGSLLLVLATPVILASALAVRLTSPGPAFFTQTRMGIGGATFTMVKIRSMVVDAESRLKQVEALSERDGLMFKMRRDPRVTRLGAFLRRFSLDELPQLVNVVRGDMSLVGPRPPLVSEYDKYHDDVHRRLLVRPGLTGLWQVSGRADLTWEESIRLDLRYVDNWSIALDMLILWRTARAVMRRSGAY